MYVINVNCIEKFLTEIVNNCFIPQKAKKMGKLIGANRLNFSKTAISL